MPPSLAVVDVRPLPPREHHATIFATFDGLPSGGKMLLVSDHDPVQLERQFRLERGDRFTWKALEEVPEEWRIEIGKAG